MTIKSVEASFSIYGKSLRVVVDGEPYILSNKISDDIWNIGGDFKSPEDNWKIRVELCKVTRRFLLSLDPTIDVSKVVF